MTVLSTGVEVVLVFGFLGFLGVGVFGGRSLVVLAFLVCLLVRFFLCAIYVRDRYFL